MVAAALSGTDRLGYLLVLRIWALDYSVADDLERCAYVRASGLAAKERWRINRGSENVRGVTRSALTELITPQKCRACCGSGDQWNMDATKIEVCRSCGGTGRKRYTGTERAMIAGIPQQTWSETWARRHDQVYALMVDAERAAIKVLHKGLS